MKRIIMLTGFAVVITVFFIMAKIRKKWRDLQKALLQ